MITLNNFLQQDIDIKSLSGKQKIAYNFANKYINMLGASQVVDSALNKSIETLNEPTPEPEKPTSKPKTSKQQTLTNPIDIFIHKAGSSFRGIPATEIKALLGALERFKKTDDWEQFKEDGILDLLEFTESETKTLGIPENYDSKKQPKTSLLTTQNYFGELKLSEVGEAIFAAYEKFASKKSNLKPVNTGQLMLFGVDDVNKQFNKELELLMKGELPKNHIFKLGVPSEPLLLAGVRKLDVELSAKKLLTKSDEKYINNHPFKLENIKNLPKSLESPLAVFSGKFGRKIVLTELKEGRHNFVLAISLFHKKPNRTYDSVINSIATISPKDNYTGLCKAIRSDLLWRDKEKMLRFIQDHGTDFHAVGIKTEHIANIIQNFNNPTSAPNNLNGKNKSLFGIRARKNKYWTEIHGEIKLVELLENGMITWDDFTKGKCTGIRAKTELFKTKKEAINYFKPKSLNGIGDVNTQFNQELDLLIHGKLPKNHVFYLGDMSDILNSLGIEVWPIEMQANRLYKKASQKNHLFDLGLLKNLPDKLNNPIMVFNSKTVKGSLVVLIELASNDNNFVVAIELNKQVFDWKKGKISIQSIRSIYPKNTITDVLNWIEKDSLLLWVDKEKALDLLVRWRSNYANATQQIKGCTNIIQNFVNPTSAPNTLNEENKNLFGLNGIGGNFSKSLKQFFAKTFKGNAIEVAYPKEFLLKNGFPNAPIVIRTTTLADKISKHQLKYATLKHLPTLINSPLMLFKSKVIEGAFNIILEKDNYEGLLCCSIHPDKKINQMVVSEIASIHGRNINQLVNWVNTGLLLDAQTKKIEKIFSDSGFNSPKSKNLLDIIANIAQKPNNPTSAPNNLNGETKNLFGLQPLSQTKKGKTYRLKGDLGQFLGEYDRYNYTIVLRGEKGAGKSRLLFQLINAFAAKRLKAAFLSLEMALNSSITQRYKNEYITKANLKRIDITDQAPTYNDLNAICKTYDVVAIDSWTKLKGITQDDFDRLQKENPNTIIICIFQSTTGKVTRGGNMPEYDAGTVIQVNKGGLAECEKNRYAPTDKIFNVFTKSLEPQEQEQLND